MSARDLALMQLDERTLPDWPRALPHHRRRPEIAEGRDLALAEQIRHGVIKNLLLLQYLTEYYSGRQLRQINPLARKVIAIALYQLRFLDRIPASAAVDQAVEQMKRWGGRGAAGFVNAVLRKAASQPSPPLPSPDQDAEAYARVALSHPAPLFQKLEKLFGVADALRFCEHDNREPPTLLRLMGSATLASLGHNLPPGVTVEAHEQPGIAVITGAKRALLAEWAVAGIAQVQDATAVGVVPRMYLEPGQNVLDRCCGLGTKTLQIHELMQGQGHLAGMDPNLPRCQTLRQLIADRTLKNIQVYSVGWMADLPPEASTAFDRILVDAPCSNSGVLARRPEARYAQSPPALASLVKLQRNLLRDTASRVRPGGLLIYSTCSVWPEENQQQIVKLLESDKKMTMEQESFTLPALDAAATHYHDGGYVAVLRRGA